jgi:hypothetical protein
MTSRARPFTAFAGLKELPLKFDAAHLNLLPVANARA